MCAESKTRISAPFSSGNFLEILKCVIILKLKKLHSAKSWNILALCFVAPCADGYATYYLMPYQICLKYFPVPVSYSTAKANCHDERANLIKIDSQEKYNIFEDYHGMFKLCNHILIRLNERWCDCFSKTNSFVKDVYNSLVNYLIKW